MTEILRVFLAISAIVVFLFVARQVKKARFGATDSLFWLLLSGGLIIIAVFPGIAYFFSQLLGFQSPSNFVFLVIIGLLLAREFSQQAELVVLRRKLTSLVQEVALNESKRRRA